MHYSTKVIQLADQEFLHYRVVDNQSLCGIKLNNRQVRLLYTLDESKLCKDCKEISPIPRIKDWCPRYQIKSGDHAISALSTLHLWFKQLQEQVQLGHGIDEFFYRKNCRTTNILVNPHPIILSVKEEEKVLEVSLIGGDGRIEDDLPFELIEEFFPLIKEDYMESLQERTN